MHNKIVVAVSGGADSATLLGTCLALGYNVYPVTFSYGSKHNKYEYKACMDICEYYGLKVISHIELDFIGQLFKSDLLSTGGDIPDGKYADENMNKTVVPGRNLIFASILAGYAESIGASRVALGVHSGDHSLYPDCRPDFIASLCETIELSSGGTVKIFAPFANITKTDIIKIGYGLRKYAVPYELTRSCYKDQEESCGVCGSCIERLEAFKSIGKTDLITYEKHFGGIMTKIISISKTFKFECSHRLTLDYDSPCKSLHGHSYTVKVTASSRQLNKNGMVLDFSELKRFQKYIDDNLDHATLISDQDERLIEFVKDQDQKHFIMHSNTTSENISKLLCDEFINMFKNKIDLCSVNVSVKETQNNEVSFMRTLSL